MDDPEEKVFGPLPDETWVYPGHGKDRTGGSSDRGCKSGASGR